jgi:serine/threonine-protein kinase
MAEGATENVALTGMVDLSRWPQADDVLDDALARPRAERELFVRSACGGDRALESAILAVLAEADGADDFLAPGGALRGALAVDLGATTSATSSIPRLPVGTRFGDYEVIALVGAGGMGEVYHGRDPRLGRDVAIKVLPSPLAVDPVRHQRLQREARLLAALNHPHIGAIYDLEDHDGVTALVLEFVDGPTLAERLARGRLALPAAIDLARQIAAALAAAHERGIVHRDLKPANVKITATGDAKVLDFGIGRAVEPPEPDEDQPEQATPASGVSPFETEDGAILGTVSYLSPERARGQRGDHRADIWAFGCVLFEMLTGTRAFPGATSAEVMAAILEREPEFSRLPVKTPAALRRLLERTLRKDPARRLGFIGDAQLDLDDGLRELEGGGGETPIPRWFRRRAWRIAALALLIGVVGGGLAIWRITRPDQPRSAHLAVPIPETDDLVGGELQSLAVSPNGRMVAYRARRNGVLQLMLRSLEAPAPVIVAGSVNAAGPFFSPDGEWLGFAGDTKLFKVSVAGGAPIPIATAPGGARGTWMEDGSILFSMGTGRVIYRVPSTGGAPVEVTRLDTASGQQLHESPSALPGGRTALVTVTYADGPKIGLANLETGVVQPIASGRQPRVLPDGRIAFARADAVWVGRLAASGPAFDGDPVEAITAIDVSSLNATAHFAVGADGTLVYLPRRVAQEARTPVWVSREGKEEALPVTPQPYTRATLSPDGRRIALALSSPEQRDVWIFDRPRAALMRLTLDPGVDTAPVWTRDGRRVAFRSERDGGGIFIVNADGSGPVRRLTRSDGPTRPAHTPYAFTPGDTALIYAELRSYSDQGIAAVTLSEPPRASVVLDGPFAEARPALSHDGRWLAYQSDESGRYEIYVRPYPGVEHARVQVSTGGGSSARWSADSREIFYFDGTSLVAVPVSGTTSLTVGRATTLFDATRFSERLGPLYDIGPDGRFLFLRQGGATGEPPRRTDLRLIAHWSPPMR